MISFIEASRKYKLINGSRKQINGFVGMVDRGIIVGRKEGLWKLWGNIWGEEYVHNLDLVIVF